MSPIVILPAYDRFLDQVVASMTLEEIVAFRLTDEENRTLQDYVARMQRGVLTPDEQDELQASLVVEEMLCLLRLKAVRLLKQF